MSTVLDVSPPLLIVDRDLGSAAEAIPDPDPVALLSELGPSGRLAAYRRGRLPRSAYMVWAARWPEEVPLVNGELEWIALGLADLD